ncbi:MAG: M23 family metallopeptidase [Cruoricaptor ignavus]|nr:M23 family metallopeptidase [Cruoricaptor ignavus]
MKHIFNKNKKTTAIIALLLVLVFAQALAIGKLYSEKDDKNYEVNLVKINTEKDSIDYLKMKSDLVMIDHSVRELNQFLLAKNMTNERISALNQDSLSNAVYMSKASNRYSQYLVDLQEKLQHVPLGIPTSGYISSHFGKRKNPIPNRTVMLASAKPAKPEPQIVEEKDSLGNVIKKTVIPQNVATSSQMPAEADQMKFHKGIDIAVPNGTEVKSAAIGTVIFAGVKGAYGNCVIISHANGLATLYAHLSQILVKTNEQVKVNQVIAKSGNTGRSTGPHLHYEIHKNNTPVNPKLFLNL